MYRIFFAALLSLLTAGFANGAPVPDVHLTLDEVSILPGAPTGLSITITNHGTTAAQLPDQRQ